MQQCPTKKYAGAGKSIDNIKETKYTETEGPVEPIEKTDYKKCECKFDNFDQNVHNWDNNKNK